jgi:predicted DNA binding CopG/RHH family protein
LTSEVLSYLPDDLKDRLSMRSLAKAARRYKGPSRNTNLLESNIVPVTHLSTQNMRLQSEKETLEKANTIQQVKLVNLQKTINNYEEQNKSLNMALAQALLWAATNKKSAETWKGRFAKAFWRLSPLEAVSTFVRIGNAGDDANTLNPTNGVDAPLFDPRTDISHIPGVMGRAGIGAPISLDISWREYYGKTFTVREETPQGPGRILATRKITPENARTLVENSFKTAKSIIVTT